MDAAAGTEPDRDVIQLIFSRVSSSSDATALDSSGDMLSYGALWHRVCLLATQLGPGDESRRIAVAINEGASAIIALLAVLASGCVFVPIDLALPDERVLHIARSVKTTTVIAMEAQRERASKLFGAEIRSLIVDDITKADGFAGPSILAPSPLPHHRLAYIYFTSGSTGWPKGVLIEHSSIAQFATENAAVYGIGPQSRVLVCSAFTFDPFVGDIITTLVTGGTVCLAPRHQLLTDTSACVAQSSATHICSTPAVWSQVRGGPSDYPSLRTLCIGGEPMSKEMIRTWASSPNLALYNTYGVTEACVYQFVQRCGPDTSPKCIGTPYRGINAAILDGDKKLVANGEAGELYIGGVQLCRSYLDEKANEGRFINLGAARLYNTGDLARRNDDGTVELLGRIDNQVKISGVRVDLLEIEEALRRCALVNSALVFFHEKHLIACYRLHSDSGIDMTVLETDVALALTLHCQRILPPAMCPAAFVHVDGPFLLSSNGKIDRKRMLDIALVKLASQHAKCDAEEPFSSSEAFVRSAWARALVLDATEIRRDANFFELGGDSLVALRLTRFLLTDERFGLDLTSEAAHSGVIKGMFAPREVMARPRFRDYHAFLALHDDFRRALHEDPNDIIPAAAQPDIDPVLAQVYGAMRKCASIGCTTLLEYFLDLAYDINTGLSRTRFGISLLHAAVIANQSCVVDVLVRRGINVFLCANLNANALHLAANLPDARIARSLIKAGVPLLITDKKRQSPVHYAARANRVECLAALLDAGSANIDGHDRWGRTPLMWAVLNGHIEAAALLLERGAYVNGFKGNLAFHKFSTHLLMEQPIHFACRLRLDLAVPMLTLLQQYGADLENLSQTRQTALHVACQRNATRDDVEDTVEYRHASCAIVQFLVLAGANVNARDVQSRTPLNFALAAHRMDYVHVLLGL